MCLLTSINTVQAETEIYKILKKGLQVDQERKTLRFKLFKREVIPPVYPKLSVEWGGKPPEYRNR